MSLLLAAEKTIAEEGRDIIVGMMIVGFIFLGVIALGQFSQWLAHKRGRAH